MLLSPDNFLVHIKNLVTGGGVSGTTRNPAIDSGFSVSRPLNIPADLRTAAGLTLTAATAPTIAASETNGLSVNSVASATALGTFVFQIPKDYDEQTDEFRINFMAAMGGATDTPTVTATIYRKRAGAALSADLAPTASAALSATSAWRTINANGKGLRAGDSLVINLVTGAHTTDAVALYAAEVTYRSTLVSANDPDTIFSLPR